MVLGGHAYEHGAWANRITESEAGVGYVWGEGIREPLRIRAGWVPDQIIKDLETFLTNPHQHRSAVLSLGLLRRLRARSGRLGRCVVAVVECQH
jgi:hypothetical protein